MKVVRVFRWWPALALCVAVLLIGRLALAGEPKPITEVEGISEYRLDNGLQVLLFSDASKPRVTVNITIFVGSRHEGYGEAGMAHLLEHMLFKGTPTHSDIPRVLKERGATYNGSTSYDRTNYFEILPAGDKNLQFALELEADRLVNSRVRAEDLESEMTVVRNEFERGENNPSSVLWKRMMSAAYLWHNYGKTTIGNRADIERVPIDKLQAFYRRYYQPDNAMLVVAGQFDPTKALDMIQRTFGTIPRPKRQLDKTYTQEPAQDGDRTVTLRRVGDVAVVGAVYHIPSGGHPDYASVDVLESTLTAQPAGRLYKALVEAKLAASVSGVAFGLHDPGVLLLMAQVTPGKEPGSVLDTLTQVTEDVGTSDVTQEEVDRAKQRLLKQRELNATDSKRLALELSEWAAQGDWRLYFLYRDRLEQVSPESVRDAARHYLRRSNRTAGVYLPVKAPDRVTIPQTPDLKAMVGDYKGREKVAEGEVFDVSPQNIEARTERFELGTGLKAVFLPKKTRGEAAYLRLTLRYGDIKSLAGQAKVAEFLAPLMTRGTSQLSRQQIQDLLDKHRVQLQAFGNAGEATFVLRTTKSHLPAALDLLRQILREPSFPEEELEILKRAELAGLERQRTEPSALAQIVVSRAINPYAKGDPRYVPTIPEEIQMTRNVTVASIRQLYGDYFSAQWGELAIVGDFDTAATRQQVTTLLADWTTTHRYERISRTGDVALQRKTHRLLTPDKENATYFAGSVFALRDDAPDYASLLLGNYILGGSSLSSRLGDRVRQKEGLSYSVGSGLRASALDQRTTFYIYAICNPENMPHLQIAIGEEIQGVLADGVTTEELDAAKSGYLQSLKVARMDDAGLARLLATDMQANRTLAFQAALEKQIQAVTQKSLLKAVRDHIDPDRLIIGIAGDFERGKTQEKATDH